MADDETPKPKGSKEKAALPFSEDTEVLDGRAWSRKPLYVLGAVVAVVVVVVVLFLALRDLEDDGDDGGGGGVPVVVSTTTTTEAPATTTSSTTTSTTAPPPTTEPLDAPCSPEEGDPDCVDPDGDGRYEVIEGGASCLATASLPEDCIDTNGDGVAGPPSRDD
jgi:hypothetical protein